MVPWFVTRFTDLQAADASELQTDNFPVMLTESDAKCIYRTVGAMNILIGCSARNFSVISGSPGIVIQEVPYDRSLFHSEQATSVYKPREMNVTKLIDYVDFNSGENDQIVNHPIVMIVCSILALIMSLCLFLVRCLVLLMRRITALEKQTGGTAPPSYSKCCW